ATVSRVCAEARGPSPFSRLSSGSARAARPANSAAISMRRAMPSIQAGNLRQVARTLVTAEESWAAPRQKLKPPAERIAGVLRLAGAQDEIPTGRIMKAQVALGAPLWRPPAPNGYPDNEAAPACTLAPRITAWLRDAVRLDAYSEARARRWSRPALSHNHPSRC